MNSLGGAGIVPKVVALFFIGVVLAVFAPFAPVHAAPTAAEHEAQTVVNLAGRQRMLTQRMTAASCVILVGVADAQRVEVAKSARTLFAQTLVGLGAGDAALGLPAQSDPVILERLAQVAQTWRTFGAAIGQVSEGDQHSVPVAQILALNIPSLKQSNAVVEALVAQYGAGKQKPALVYTIDVAGRQRMLSQKIMKEACFWLVGLDDRSGEQTLRATIALFSQSLGDLQNGNDAAGIIAPPTPEIAAQLEQVSSDWDTYVAGIEALIQIDDPRQRRAGLTPLAVLSDKVLVEMNRAVSMYVEQ